MTKKYVASLIVFRAQDARKTGVFLETALASSATGGASPISMCVTIYTSQAASVENARQWRAFYARSGLQAPN